MSISILDPCEFLDERSRSFAERRFQFALSRFGPRIRYAEVVLSDENTSPESKALSPNALVRVSHECHVTIILHGAMDVILTERNPDLERCIARAAERTGRAIGRSIEQIQSHDRLSSIPQRSFKHT